MVPASAMNSAAIASAIASISVELPVPLSPASSVTGESSARSSIAATAGTS
jgi:hypothetical protein